MFLGKPRNFFSLSDNNYIKLICRQWPVIFMFFVCLDTHKIPKTLTFKEKDNPLMKTGSARLGDYLVLRILRVSNFYMSNIYIII